MMPAAKQFDPVMGVDIHIILIPTPGGPVPTPLPHPFIGMVFDPMDFVPIIGASVMVNGIPRAQAGTAAKNIPPHIPMGGPFQKPPGNEGEMFMGSMTVLAEGEPFTFMACPVLSCQDIGMPAPGRKKKKSTSMMLPTSVVLAIPAGMPVLVGGPPMISMTAMAMKIGLAALKKLAKKFKKKPKKPKNKAPKARNTGDCTAPGHPVDVANGRLFTEISDFSLPGIIPLEWKRAWFSDHAYDGPLGYGWSHCYDMALWEETEDGEPMIALRFADGRIGKFQALETGDSANMRAERITLMRDDRGYFLRDKDLLVYRFERIHPQNGQRLLSSIENLNGHRIQFTYNEYGVLHQILDTANRRLDVYANQQGKIVRIDAPHPDQPEQTIPLISYSYDQHSNLVQSQDTLGYAMRYEYRGHLLIRETYRTGLNFFFQFDGTDHTARCTRTWGDGGIYDTKLTYFDGYTLVEDSHGHKTTHYHENGLVYKTIDPLGNISHKHYNEFLELTGEKDALGFGPVYGYDDNGNRNLSIDANGGATQLEYNALNLPVKATDPVGGQWEWEYDENGNLAGRKDPLGRITQYKYKNGLLSEIINPAGNVTTLGFDAALNLNMIATPDQQASWWGYDRLGRCIETVDPKGNIQRRTYDYLGRITEVKEPDGNIRRLQYDGEGNVTRAVDQHHDVQFEYGGFNRLAARMEAGTRVEFHYDKEERLTGIMNENRQVYRFVLNGNGEVVEERGFDGLLRVYERDATGRVAAIQRPGNQKTIYAYDANGQVTQIRHADGSTEAYKYREDGELLEAANDQIKVQFERDVLGRIVKEIQGGYEVASQFDDLGFRTGVQSSLGANLVFRRNLMGDVEEVGSQDWFTRFRRDAVGLELEREYSGGLRNRWSRDKLGRPLRQETFAGGGGQMRTRTYRWEANDRLKEIMDTQRGTTRFEHDAVGNLAWAQNPDGSFDFRMPDAVGNLFRTQERKDRQYGPAGQLLQAGSTRYEYDLEGNLIRKTAANGKVWYYEWNASGMLKRVIRPDGQTVAFEYDALGRRIAKSYQGRTTRWIWDGNIPLHEWIEPSEDFMRPVRADLPGSLQQQTTQEKKAENLITWVFEPETFTPLAKMVGDTRYGIITDHLGTPLSMHAPNGQAVWSADLNIYGEVKNMRGRAEDCPFRFPGQYEDVETGLYYNRFRYFDTEGGEYLCQDPIGLKGGCLNIYAYVHDPSSWVDTLGLSPFSRICGSAVDKASQLPLIKKGTKEWDDAVKALRKNGRGDIRVGSIQDAKDLLKEARGNMNRYKNYTDKPYKKGFEIHNFKNQRELDVGNDLRHIKWSDWGGDAPGQGHIFFGD